MFKLAVKAMNKREVSNASISPQSSTAEILKPLEQGSSSCCQRNYDILWFVGMSNELNASHWILVGSPQVFGKR